MSPVATAACIYLGIGAAGGAWMAFEAWRAPNDPDEPSDDVVELLARMRRLGDVADRRWPDRDPDAS
jgi:hypothetical protein